jgi:hypothetical protein
LHIQKSFLSLGHGIATRGAENENHLKGTIMNIRILAVSAVALSLLAPAAFAGNSLGYVNTLPGSEDNFQQKDYLVNRSPVVESKAFVVTVNEAGLGSFSNGDYIGETNAQRNQRSSR